MLWLLLLDTIAAPTRHVFVANFSVDDGLAATDAEGAAAAYAGAMAGLVVVDLVVDSRVDNITGPICQVRVSNFSPDCC